MYVLRRVADGDAAAVDECLSLYSGLVWSLARRMCPRHQDAEDAVQEIFIEIWRNAAKYNSDVASEATYITMIARRRLIDRYRRRSRTPDTKPLAEELVDAEVDHERQVDLSDEAAQAQEQLKRLRPEEQKILELSINEGMSQSQIADMMNLPLGTVKTHARRGLIRLRELLGVDAVGRVKGGQA